jgi:hypothetical protein
MTAETCGTQATFPASNGDCLCTDAQRALPATGGYKRGTGAAASRTRLLRPLLLTDTTRRPLPSWSNGTGARAVVVLTALADVALN